ncbi:MAG: chemotaxis protein CheW [Sedimentisphaerales bacterium]|nr:chemotaxis protein CheW [Sedimentisphaerales bacterium]
MDLTQNLLFITYYLKTNKSEMEVSCRGCKEIACYDYELPAYIRGMIEFEGENIPVIDPNMYFRGRPSNTGNLTCVLVIEYVHEYRNCRAAILIEDIDDVMNLAAGNYRNAAFSFNMNFIIEALKKGTAEQFLLNTQRLIEMNEKRAFAVQGSLRKHHSIDMKAEEIELDEYEIFNPDEFNEYLVTI